eukprot:scpid100447/ scgid14847/ 
MYLSSLSLWRGSTLQFLQECHHTPQVMWLCQYAQELAELFHASLQCETVSPSVQMFLNTDSNPVAGSGSGSCPERISHRTGSVGIPQRTLSLHLEWSGV